MRFLFTCQTARGESVKSPIRKLLLILAGFAVLGVLGVGGFYAYRNLTRPTMEKSGGTVLVYEVDVDRFPEGKLPAQFQMEEMAAVLRRRVDATDRTGITVTPVGPLRVEIAVPRPATTRSRCKESRTWFPRSESWSSASWPMKWTTWKPSARPRSG